MSAGHDHAHTFDGMNDDYKRRLMLVTGINIAMFALEILVAVLQAYVFAILTCLYLRDALHLH